MAQGSTNIKPASIPSSRSQKFREALSPNENSIRKEPLIIPEAPKKEDKESGNGRLLKAHQANTGSLRPYRPAQQFFPRLIFERIDDGLRAATFQKGRVSGIGHAMIHMACPALGYALRPQ